MSHELKFVLLKDRVVSFCGHKHIEMEDIIDYMVEFSELTQLQISEEDSSFRTQGNKIIAIIALRSDKPVYNDDDEEYIYDDEYFHNHTYTLNDWRD